MKVKEININPLDVLNKGIIKGVENLNPNDKECQLQQVGIDLRINLEEEKVLVLNPGESANIKIYETFDMQDYYGLLYLRSSFCKRRMLLSSGIFDPGFRGYGGCSLFNLGDKKIEIPHKFRFAQMIVFKASPASYYQGFYNNNSSTESKYKDL